MAVELTREQRIHKLITEDRLAWNDKPEEIKTFRDYARGNHAIVMPDGMKQQLENLLGNKFCDNICRKIVVEGRNRLNFQGWTCENTQVQEWLSNLYTTGKLQQRQSSFHYSTIRDGNFGVAVGWNNERQSVQFFREKWWDGNEGLFIGYNAQDIPFYAVKEWTVKQPDGEPIRQRNIWFDSELQRWRSTDNGATWEPYQERKRDPETGRLTGELEPWPVPWRTVEGAPLRIPFVHFANTDVEDTDNNYGTAILDGGVTGLQDQVNAIQWAISYAAAKTGFQQIWVSGLTLKPDPADPTGRTYINEPSGEPGAVWVLDKEGARVGVIPAGSIDQLILAHSSKMQAMARMTQTPLHAITGGDWPSGEALIRAEQPAVGAAESRISSLVDAYIYLAHKAVTIHNRFSIKGPKLPEDPVNALIGARFAPPERRDLLTRATIANAVKDIVSEEESLKILGYSESEIERIMEQKRKREKEQQEQFAQSFDRGTAAGSNLPGRGAGAEEPDPDEE